MLPDFSRRAVFVPLIVACALFMEQLDSTIIATALPPIAVSLHEPALRLSLAITSYLLSLAVFIPLSGWVADRYGARRVFRSAIVVFTCGSVLCAASRNMPELVGARILQGIGGAMMVPVGRLLLLRQVEKRELVSAMSFLTVPALFAPLIGPPLGGFIATYWSWRWIFLINVPVGALGFVLVGRFIQDLRVDDPPPLDLKGWLIAAPALAAVVFALEGFGKQVLPGAVLGALLGAGLLMLVLYYRHARGRPGAVLDIGLLQLRTYRSSLLGGSCFRVATGGYMLLLPLMLQLGFGRSALESGLVTFAGAAGALLLKTAAPWILRRYGFRRLLVGNSLLCALMLLVIGAFRPSTPEAMMIGVLLVGGFLRSLQFTCVNALAYSDVTETRMSRATSFASTAQQLSLTLGVCLAAQLLALSLDLRAATALLPIDFSAAFAGLALLSLLPLMIYLRLPADAGEAISGHRAAGG